MFPTAAFTPLGKTRTLDFWSPAAAPAGTPIEHRAEIRRRARARRRSQPAAVSPTPSARRRLGSPHASSTRRPTSSSSASLGRSFDVIDASGVLHHMADPIAGWRMLLSLLRPRRLHASRPLQRDRAPRRGGGARLHRRARLRLDAGRHSPLPAGSARTLRCAASRASAIFSAPANAATCCSTCRKRRLTIPEIKSVPRRATACDSSASSSTPPALQRLPRAVRRQRLVDDRPRPLARVRDRIPGYLLGHVSVLGAEKLSGGARSSRKFAAARTKSATAGYALDRPAAWQPGLARTTDRETCHADNNVRFFRAATLAMPCPRRARPRAIEYPWCAQYSGGGGGGRNCGFSTPRAVHGDGLRNRWILRTQLVLHWRRRAARQARAQTARRLNPGSVFTARARMTGRHPMRRSCLVLFALAALAALALHAVGRPGRALPLVRAIRR